MKGDFGFTAGPKMKVNCSFQRPLEKQIQIFQKTKNEDELNRFNLIYQRF